MKTIDIKTFSDALQESMKAKLVVITEGNREVISSVSKSLALVKSRIDELRAFVHQYEFQCNAEEIEFFKCVKPIIVSQYYYYEKLFALKMNEPLGEPSIIREYYYNELNRLQEYALGHKEFYAYYLSGATHLDELYFLSRPAAFISPDTDPRFSTGYDGILAMILANRRISEYAQKVLKDLNTDPCKTSPLTWTTKKAYLVELIYALHGVEAINNGKAEIKQIASLFESLFNVSLGNFYRHFTEIGIRKTGRTNFIDQLKVKLEKRLDDLM
jgi:hypothetical protein